MLEAHYAPQGPGRGRRRVDRRRPGPAILAASEHGGAATTVVVLAPTAIDDLPDEVIELEPAGPADDFARVLYDRLRQADRLGADVLLVVPPPAAGVGAAVRDRLRRAAASSPTEPTVGSDRTADPLGATRSRSAGAAGYQPL